jgi:hypothetical protein
MSRHISLLILSSLLSAFFPSIGWTQTCFLERPTCAVRCPMFDGANTVQITCQNHTTYYACNDKRHSLPSLSQCTCPSNLGIAKNVIYYKESLKLANLSMPAIEVTCITSNKAGYPSSSATQIVPNSSSLNQPLLGVAPSPSPSASHNPSVSPPINTPQTPSPSNNESLLNVSPSHDATSDSPPTSSNTPTSHAPNVLPSNEDDSTPVNLLKRRTKNPT